MKELVLSPQLNKRLISTLMSSRNTEPNDNNNFTLKSSSEFSRRSGDVFGKLDILENKHELWVSENSTDLSSKKTDDMSLNEIDPGVFKKPFPVHKSKRKGVVPQYVKQPQKWIKYSLEDIPVSSDATNSAVGLQFIDELRKRRLEKQEVEEDSGQILFKTPRHKICRKTVESEASGPSVSRLCSNTSKSNQPISKVKVATPNVKLDHLQ